MAVKIRLSGEPEELAQTIALLDQVLELAWDGRSYPNRGAFGARAYLDARPRSGPVSARAERIEHPSLPGEPPEQEQ